MRALAPLLAVLALAAEAGSAVVDQEALTMRLITDRGLSTQEATWALLAANALIDRAGAEGITIDGAAASGPLVRVLDATNTAPVKVKNDSAVDTTLTLTTYGVPSEPEPAGGNGYAITRSYYTLEGEPVTLEDVTGDKQRPLPSGTSVRSFPQRFQPHPLRRGQTRSECEAEATRCP